jgi:hypothetical protein
VAGLGDFIIARLQSYLVEILRCHESIRDIIIYQHMNCRWNWTMLNLCGIVAAILKMATGRNVSIISRIDCRHLRISTGCHFQIGRHNTSNIQLCPISSKFDMLVENDITNWLLTSKNFYPSPFSKWPQCWICAVLWRPFWKWRPVEMFRCQESIRDIIIYLHMKWHWNRTMLHLWVDYDVPKWFLTSKNFYRSQFGTS